MIEDTLEEEILQEFKGGTLAINNQDTNKPNNDKSNKPDSPDKNNDNTKTNNENYWSANFISPLTSIPNKISATLWKTSKQEDATDVNSTTNNSSQSVQQTISIAENPNNYFTFRESVLARALKECKEQFLDEEADGPLLEAFLLTQISHWNSDKERLLLLTPQSLVIAKYDFIALKRLSYKKLPLSFIRHVIVGSLVYPSGSLVPQMNGLVDGLSNVLENCLFARWSKTDNNQQLTSFYQPRNRNMKGMRLLWDIEKPENFTSYWNPFNENVPFCTFTFHPLYFHKDCVDEKLRSLYCVETFVEKLCKTIAELPKTEGPNYLPCTVQEKDIILQCYVGIGSVIYNRNALGFFKVRGKFSF